MESLSVGYVMYGYVEPCICSSFILNVGYVDFGFVECWICCLHVLKVECFVFRYCAWLCCVWICCVWLFGL